MTASANRLGIGPKFQSWSAVSDRDRPHRRRAFPVTFPKLVCSGEYRRIPPLAPEMRPRGPIPPLAWVSCPRHVRAWARGRAATHIRDPVRCIGDEYRIEAVKPAPALLCHNDLRGRPPRSVAQGVVRRISCILRGTLGRLADRSWLHFSAGGPCISKPLEHE
jgi:hypothetical protein